MCRDGADAVSGAGGHCSVYRPAGEGLHSLRPLQQGERAPLPRLLRENGPGEWLELSHLP